MGLSEALRELKVRTQFCEVCYNITEESPCPICRDPERDAGLLCVVESPLDVLAIEKTGVYNGRYHVLHGAISPVEGIGPEDLKIGQLLARLQGGSVAEVIVATNPTLEGEATAMYLQKQMGGGGLRISRLARGLPIGGDLEYVDEVTLTRALEGRSEM
jgi:recombination protein RecR